MRNGQVVEYDIFEIDAIIRNDGPDTVAFICDGQQECKKSDDCHRECFHTCDINHIKYGSRYKRKFIFHNNMIFEQE